MKPSESVRIGVLTGEAKAKIEKEAYYPQFAW